MITYYCPRCWEIIEEGQKTCPSCGYRVEDFTHFDFDDKLIAALHHPVSERKIMAAQILGVRQCTRALPVFRKILESDENNYFFLRAILFAVAKFEGVDREEILSQARNHTSELVSQLAAELLDEIHAGKKPGMWDRNTG